jgi:hypothetical protein
MRFDDLAAGGAVPPPPPPSSPPPQYPPYQQPAPPSSYQQPAYQQPPPPSIEQTLSYQQPAPAPARRGSVTMGRANVRILPLVGAALIALGAFLPWFSLGELGSVNSLDIPVQFLFDPTGTTGEGGFSIGIVLLILGIGGAVLTFMPATGTLRRVVGMVAVLVAVVYLFQLVTGFEGASFMDVITEAVGFGVYVSLVGGVLLAATK